MKYVSKNLIRALTLGIALTAYAGSEQMPNVVWAETVGRNTRQQDSKQQGFINVEGSDLQTKLSAARKLAQSRGELTPFWIAYSFPVREGIAFDSVPGVNGVVSGKVSGYETRSLGIFLLHGPRDLRILRIEVRNLERDRREKSVYWLGMNSSEQSLKLLEGIVRNESSTSIAEAATDAIALHDEAARVAPLLRDFAERSPVVAVRRASVMWLGRLESDVPFLETVVRNEGELTEVRGQAAVAIGKSRNPEAVTTLRRLHDSVQSKEVKDEILRMLFKKSKAGRAHL